VFLITFEIRCYKILKYRFLVSLMMTLDPSQQLHFVFTLILLLVCGISTSESQASKYINYQAGFYASRTTS